MANMCMSLFAACEAFCEAFSATPIFATASTDCLDYSCFLDFQAIQKVEGKFYVLTGLEIRCWIHACERERERKDLQRV